MTAEVEELPGRIQLLESELADLEGQLRSLNSQRGTLQALEELEKGLPALRQREADVVAASEAQNERVRARAWRRADAHACAVLVCWCRCRVAGSACVQAGATAGAVPSAFARQRACSLARAHCLRRPLHRNAAWRAAGGVAA